MRKFKGASEGQTFHRVQPYAERENILISLAKSDYEQRYPSLDGMLDYRKLTQPLIHFKQLVRVNSKFRSTIQKLGRGEEPAFPNKQLCDPG